MTTIQEIIKNHILEEIFNEFPTNLDANAFDFFLRADVNCSEFVEESALGTEWGFTVCEAYEFDNIRAIRGLMTSMYNDLDRLKSSLFQYATKNLQINKDECISDDVFYELVQSGNGTLYRQGTADEYAIIHTISEEALL